MKCYVKYIAVLDKNELLHRVEFTPGVNVITGKSSTGKSAMIEIFDYCFGSSDYTIPEGVITEWAKLYIVILSFDKSSLILARKPGEEGKKIFLKIENDEFVSDLNNLKSAYFDKYDFIPLKDFNVELGHYFGLNITDTDEDEKIRELRGRKDQRPSIRHTVSYMLQHQNLIANKHSLFYRFDEEEKRKETIDQFKIFAKFVTQDYYIKQQELNDLLRVLRKLELKREREIDYQKTRENKFTDLISEYKAVTGMNLFDITANMIIKHPKNYLEKIGNKIVDVDYQSGVYENDLKNLHDQRNTILGEKRRLQSELYNVKSSIDYANEYIQHTKNFNLTEKSSVQEGAACPFCNSSNENLQNKRNELQSAIKWLNDELKKTPYMLDSFKAEERKLENEIAEKANTLSQIERQIKNNKAITEKLTQKQTLERQGSKILYKIEVFLEETIDYSDSDLEKEIADKNTKIKALEKNLKDNFDVAKKMQAAQNTIKIRMNEIGNEFDFENSYKPIDLEFDLKSFDLYHNKNDKKIFLRSMGSGANWLYSHLTLFLSLQYYFCTLKNACVIPSILFLDQPSQVYFPSIETDEGDKFDASKLRKDSDIQAVTNLYEQLVKHCIETEKRTGIMPQIIVTDHADHLKLKNADFEKLVNGRRWRTHGFIEGK